MSGVSGVGVRLPLRPDGHPRPRVVAAGVADGGAHPGRRASCWWRPQAPVALGVALLVGSHAPRRSAPGADGHRALHGPPATDRSRVDRARLRRLDGLQLPRHPDRRRARRHPGRRARSSSRSSCSASAGRSPRLWPRRSSCRARTLASPSARRWLAPGAESADPDEPGHRGGHRGDHHDHEHRRAQGERDDARRQVR